jgi:HD-GYP domain-containing protein (c-di-GMP phosphodiesterase class II)
VIVDLGGYRMAWIGMAQRDPEKSVRPVAWAGERTEFFSEQMDISWADSLRGRGTIGTAIRDGEPQISQHIATDPRMSPWAALAREYGIAATASLPLKDHSGVFAVLVIYAVEPNAFDADELRLLQELASDLSFGIGAIRERTGRELSDQRWRTSLEATVGAIASTVEMRDQYTAGHQQRVAKLAVAVARRLSMSEHDIQGIYLAGIIHDVGKISIPAEILSKPGKLSEIEFQLIKTHAQAGYDIIKGVEFPWPIAQLVLQHHERLDGSGYPQGLRGDAMLGGAKILAVADVVEAMMSHRPYRPALGIDVALAEIEKGKGTLFDPEAVDACVSLFQDGFHFD